MPNRIVITGGSSGIGLELAKIAVENGYSVLISGRSREKLDVAAGILRGLGGKQFVTVNGCVSESAADIAEAASILPGERLILINNAGCFHPDPTEAQIRDMTATNFQGLILVTQALLPQLKESQGQIINVLSVAAVRNYPGSAVYGATKSGALKYSYVLRDEVEGKVGISNTFPGATDTPLWDNQPFTIEDMMPARHVAERIFALIGQPDQDIVIE